MPVSAFVGALLTSILQSAAYDFCKALVKGPDSLESLLHKAALQATEDFEVRYKDEFGSHQDCFLARAENWEIILNSLFFNSEALTPASFNPEGYIPGKAATVEALEYFIQRLNVRIAERQVLNQHLAQKAHIKEQTQNAAAIKESLLQLTEEVRSLPQEFSRTIEASLQSLISASTLGTGKEAADELINEEIDRYRNLIRGSNPSAAIMVLEDLRAKKWGQLSPYQQFRILTNIAAAKLRLGDYNSAALGFLEAEKLAPTDKKALTNSAIAHHLLGNPAAAKIKAEEAVHRFPKDPDAYKALVIALYNDKTCTDPLPLIPPEMLSFQELCLQIGDFFHQKNNLLESRKWLRRAYELCPADDDTQEAFATSVLQELLEEKAIVLNRQMTAAQRQFLTQVRDILSALWTKYKNSDVYSRYLATAVNLSVTERLLGNFNQALALTEEALHKDQQNIHLQKQMCFGYMSSGRFSDAYNILNAMPDDATEEKLVVEAEVLVALNRHEEALVVIDRFLGNHLDTQLDLYIAANVIKVQSLEKVRGVDAALAAAMDLAESHPTIPDYPILVSDRLLHKGEKEQATEWTQRASDLSCTYPEKLMVAHSYFDLGKFVDAAKAYKNLLLSYDDSPILRRLFQSYLSADLRAEALDLATKIPDEVKRLRFYGRACAELYYRVGNRLEAQKHLEICLKETPLDLELQLNYMSLLERMGKKDTVRARLQELPTFHDSVPLNLIQLANLYGRYGMEEQALQVGYDTLRRFQSDPNVHLGYCWLLLQTVKSVAAIDHVGAKQVVQPDTVFTCLTSTGRRTTYLIESGVKNDVMGEITPEHPIAIKAHGLGVGDSFILADGPIGIETAEITEINHKYLHALHESMNNFQYRFPEVPGMWMFSLRHSPDGELDLAPILDAVSRMSDAVLRKEQIYANNPVPLALFAHSLGKHPLDCLMGMVSGRRVKIKCCNGDHQERQLAFELVAAAKEGIIVDPFSLYTLYSLGLLDSFLITAGGKVGIPQSTLDFFDEFVEERLSGGAFLSLSKEGDEFCKTEVSEGDIDVSVVPFQKIAAWCRQHCNIVLAVGNASMDQDFRQLFDGLHPVFLDTLLAASGSGMLLVSEDLHYRQIAKMLFNLEGVWCQPLLQVGVHQNHLPEETYHRAILGLVDMNYSFISVSGADLFYQLQSTGFTDLAGFKRLARALEGPHVDLISALNVTVDFIQLLLQDTRLASTIEKAIYAILNSLTAGKSTGQLQMVISLYRILARRFFFDGTITEQHLQFVNHIFGAWSQGHFLLAGKRQIA